MKASKSDFNGARTYGLEEKSCYYERKPGFLVIIAEYCQVVVLLHYVLAMILKGARSDPITGQSLVLVNKT